ncbi:MAG: MobA/MobL family protein, partial [Chloroflexota bacterium]
NYHVHLLSTTREVTASGLGAKTVMELSDTDRRKRGLPTASEEITWLRTRWSELANEHLHAAGQEARIDPRSLKAQGIERAPTEHLGPKLTAMQRRGRNTEVGWRVEQEATKRLALAAELGRVMRESLEVHRSILEVCSDLAAAQRARVLEALRAHAPAVALPRSEPSARPAPAHTRDSRLELSQDLTAAKAAPTETVAELAERTRARAVESWLDWKTDQRRKSAEREKDKAQDADTTRDRKANHDYGL